MGIGFRVAMFITSFIPLWVTIIFKNVLNIVSYDKNLYTEIISIVVIIVANLLSIAIIGHDISKVKKEMTIGKYTRYNIIDAKQEKGITSEFLLSYVLPLFAFDFHLWTGVVQFLIYFFTLTFLCVRNNNVYANLIFEIKGYKFYNCNVQWSAEKTTSPMDITIVSKINLTAQIGNTIDIASLNKPLYLAK